MGAIITFGELQPARREAGAAAPRRAPAREKGGLNDLLD